VFIGTAGALGWIRDQGYRFAPLNVPPDGKPGFTQLPAAVTGITFTNLLSDEKAAENQIRLNGSGVASGDIDGDGLCDLYFCRLEGPNVLYRNRGNWTFEDITASAGVACPDQFSQGALFADVDGDGDLDLLVTAIGGGTGLFRNEGRGKFTESITNGLVRRFAGTTMAMADVDGDGDLDLYVANNRTTTIRSTGIDVYNIGGRRVLRPEDRDDYEFTPEGLLLEHGEVDFLYLNDGRGNFSPLSWTDGTFVGEDGKPLPKPPRDWGLSVMFRDINGDGSPDIYVCNDFHSIDRIWINDGKGRFRAIHPLALRHASTFSMGIDFADINRDGHDDFFVADMLGRQHQRRKIQLAAMVPAAMAIGKYDDRPQVDRNTLQLNRGDGTYAEIAYYSGLEASDWSWLPLFLDVDLDGFEDLLITTGHLFDTQDLDTETQLRRLGPTSKKDIGKKLLRFPRLQFPKVAFRNRGDLTFEETGSAWGFSDSGVSHGMALADLDNDGDLDVVVNNLNAPAGIYRNDSNAPRLAVRLKGRGANTQGIGARIKVLGGPAPQSQEVICGGHYLSGSDPVRVFAAGQATNLTIEVTWRNGKRRLVQQAKPNCIYEIDEEGPEAISPSLALTASQYLKMSVKCVITDERDFL